MGEDGAGHGSPTDGGAPKEAAPVEGFIAAFAHGDEASPTVVHPLPPGHGTEGGRRCQRNRRLR